MSLQPVEETDSVALLDSFFFLFVSGKYHCPVLYNVFTNNSHIVVNKVTGNVFSHEVGALTLSLH